MIAYFQMGYRFTWVQRWVLGKVTRLGDNYVGVEIAPGVEVQLQRTAVVQVLPKGSIK